MNFILQMKSMVNFFFLLTKQAQNKTIKTYLRNENIQPGHQKKSVVQVWRVERSPETWKFVPCSRTRRVAFSTQCKKTDVSKLSEYHGEFHNGEHPMNPEWTRRVHLAVYCYGNTRFASGYPGSVQEQI